VAATLKLLLLLLRDDVAVVLQSIGGAVSTGTHGSNLGPHKSVSNQVKQLLMAVWQVVTCRACAGVCWGPYPTAYQGGGEYSHVQPIVIAEWLQWQALVRAVSEDSTRFAMALSSIGRRRQRLSC